MNLLAFIIDQFSEDDDCHSLVVGRLAGYLAKEAGIPPTQCLKQKSLDFAQHWQSRSNFTALPSAYLGNTSAH